MVQHYGHLRGVVGENMLKHSVDSLDCLFGCEFGVVDINKRDEQESGRRCDEGMDHEGNKYLFLEGASQKRQMSIFEVSMIKIIG